MWFGLLRRRPANIADAATDANGRRRRLWNSGRSVLVTSACLVLLSFAILARMVLSFVALPRSLELEQRCRMSRMWPSYVAHSPPSPSGLDKKYRLLLYRERPPDLQRNAEQDLPRGRPALFVPGNAGSYGQVRSVASSSYHQYRAMDQHGAELDWWTVDFNEDFSAFHGGTMDEQATYLNEVISYLVNHVYVLSSHPVKVPILGHSMGGLVARLMLEKDNHVRGSVDTIVTLSSPHAYPPVPLDVGVEEIYERVNRKAWESESRGATSKELLLISLSGGVLDNQLASEPSSLRLARLANNSVSLSAFTASMAGLWSGVDHLAMMWCDQLRSRVAQGFIADVEHQRSLLQRRELWRTLLGIEDEDAAPALRFLPYEKQSKEEQKGHVEVYNVDSSPRAFQLITSLDLGPADLDIPGSGQGKAALEVRLCSASKKSCQAVSANAFTVFPPSRPEDISFPEAEARYEVSGVGLRRLYLASSQLRQMEVSHVEIETQTEGTGSLDARFVSESPLVQPSGFLSLLWGLTASFGVDSDSLVIPAMDSSLLAYDVDFLTDSDKAAQCTLSNVGVAGTAPLVRAQDLATGDLQYYPSINPKSPQRRTLTLHSTSPFMPPGKIRGTVFRRFFDPCHQLTGTRVRINWTVSAGLLVSRYRTALVGYPFAIVSLLCAKVWHEWDQSGHFPSPSLALAWHSGDILAFSAFVVIVTALVQTTLLDLFPASTSTSSQALQDAVVGLGSSSLLYSLIIGPVLLIAAYGLALWISLVLEGLVGAVAHVLQSCKIDSLLSLPMQASNRDARPEDSKIQIKRVTLLGFVLVVVVLWTAVPIQFAVLAAFVVHLLVSIRSALPLTGKRSVKAESKRADQHAQHLLLLNVLFWVVPLHAPVLLVWSRNLINGWIAPLGSSSDHNVLRVLSILLVVQVASSGRLLERAKSSTERTLTRVAFLLVGVYALVYGIRHTYRISALVNGVLSWILFVHFRARWLPASTSVSPTRPSDYPGRWDASKEGEEKEDDVLLGDHQLLHRGREDKGHGQTSYSNLPQEVADVGEEVPESIRASMLEKCEEDNQGTTGAYQVEKEGGDDDEGKESEVLIDAPEVKLSELDEALARYLELLDEYIAMRKENVDQRLSTGHLYLGKAKMQLGRFRLGEDGWDARMKATKCTVWDESNKSWTIQEREVEDDEEEGEVMEEKGRSTTDKAEGLRRRKGQEQKLGPARAEDDDGHDSKKENSAASAPSKDKAKRKVQRYDALYQFTALPPPSLRRAQEEFGKALQGLAGTLPRDKNGRTVMQVLGEMQSVEEEIVELKRMKEEENVIVK